MRLVPANSVGGGAGPVSSGVPGHRRSAEVDDAGAGGACAVDVAGGQVLRAGGLPGVGEDPRTAGGDWAPAVAMNVALVDENRHRHSRTGGWSRVVGRSPDFAVVLQDSGLQARAIGAGSTVVAAVFVG